VAQLQGLRPSLGSINSGRRRYEKHRVQTVPISKRSQGQDLGTSDEHLCGDRRVGACGMQRPLILGARARLFGASIDHEGVRQEASAHPALPNARLKSVRPSGGSQGNGRKGVVWNVGKVFHGDKRVLFRIQALSAAKTGQTRHLLLSTCNSRIFEKYRRRGKLAWRSRKARLEIRGRNVVTGMAQQGDHVCCPRRQYGPDGLPSLRRIG